MTALIVVAVTLSILAAATAGAWLAIVTADTVIVAVTRFARRRRDVATARRFDAALLDAHALFVDARNGYRVRGGRW